MCFSALVKSLGGFLPLQKAIFPTKSSLYNSFNVSLSKAPSSS